MFPKGQQMQKLLFSTPDKLSDVQETFWLYPIHSLSVCFFVHAVNGYRPKHCPKSRNRVLSYTMCWYTQSNSMSFIGKENASLNLIWMLKSDKFINTFCPVSYFYLFITIFTIRECTGLPSCLVDGFPFRQLTWLVSPGSSYLSSLSLWATWKSCCVWLLPVPLKPATRHTIYTSRQASAWRLNH